MSYILLLRSSMVHSLVKYNQQEGYSRHWSLEESVVEVSSYLCVVMMIGV